VAVVVTERIDRTLVIRIDRPEVMNAIDHRVAAGIGTALEQLDADADLAVGVITGGATVFSAGADLTAIDAGGPGPYAAGRGFAGLVERIPRKPLVAAVEGWALGGGLEIVLACDLVTAARTARLGLPEAKLGLTAGGGGAIRLPRILPRAIALEMLLTGEPISAEEAHRWGLVNRLTEAGGALEAALALAAAVGENSAIAVPAIAQVARSSMWLSDDEAFAWQAPIFAAVEGSDDTRRRVAEFAHRRSAHRALSSNEERERNDGNG
jgi:enoyl-CoA hydratase